MVSIITAIYNQLGMNKLYYESVKKQTSGDWELIIIDNGSTDGSREFFQNLGDPRVKVITNDGNYSYPYCQNIGIKHAGGDLLAFLNNDLLLPPKWDERIREVIGKDGYEVLTLSSNDRMPDPQEARHYNGRYKHVKYPLLALFCPRKSVLSACVRHTYGNWDRHCEKVWKKWGHTLVRGFSGSAVIMSRKAIEIFKEWDPSQQAADYDMYLRTSKRWDTHGDVRPMSVVGGIYHHHFSRLTSRMKYPPFVDAANLTSIEEKWPEEYRAKYLPLMK